VIELIAEEKRRRTRDPSMLPLLVPSQGLCCHKIGDLACPTSD
jgi:hypothetical protein